MDTDISQEPILIEYRDNNRIHIIHINSMTREAVDAYVDMIQTEIVENESSLLLSIHNYSHVGGTISPYYLGRIKEFTGDKMRADGHGRVAVITSVDLFRLMLNPVIKVFTRSNDKLAIQFFKTVDEAVEWVSEYQE